MCSENSISNLPFCKEIRGLSRERGESIKNYKALSKSKHSKQVSVLDLISIQLERFKTKNDRKLKFRGKIRINNLKQLVNFAMKYGMKISCKNYISSCCKKLYRYCY